MSAEFFFEKLQQAVQMDATNKELGKDCLHIFEAMKWTEAYKASLSQGKQKDFEKAWRKCEAELASARKFADFGKK